MAKTSSLRCSLPFIHCMVYTVQCTVHCIVYGILLLYYIILSSFGDTVVTMIIWCTVHYKYMCMCICVYTLSPTAPVERQNCFYCEVLQRLIKCTQYNMQNIIHCNCNIEKSIFRQYVPSGECIKFDILIIMAKSLNSLLNTVLLSSAV